MPENLTFDTKSTEHGWTTEHTLRMPSSAEDVDLIVQRYGSMERMIDRANAQHKVDVQRGMRLHKTPAEARDYADNFVNNGKKATVKTVVVDTAADDAPEFDEKQLAYLIKSGAIIR